MYANKFCDAGQVPIFRYFEACVGDQKKRCQDSPCLMEFSASTQQFLKQSYIHYTPMLYMIPEE